MKHKKMESQIPQMANLQPQKPKGLRSKLIKNPKKFSLRQLSIFGLIFAVIGGYFIFRSFADTPTTVAIYNDKAVYNTSDFYGINIPDEIFPDAIGTEGSIRIADLRSQILKTGSDWIRTDASASLYRAFFENGREDECPNNLAVCDINKLGDFKILAAIDHVTVRSTQYQSLPCSNLDYGKPDLETFTLDDWKKVVDCVSKKFKGKIQAYEIWNEPTIFKYGYQDGTAEHYFDMLKSAYQIIKQNDPSALVIGLGGLDVYAGGTDGSQRVDAAEKFAKVVKELGGKQYADAISVHGYSWNDCSPIIWNVYESNFNYYKNLWEKDVWMTETGQRSDQACSQSTYIDYAYSAFINSGAKRLFWFALKDADGPFGVEGKPAQDYLKQFISSPKNGQLRIETSPAAEAGLSVHPGFVRTWGVNWESLQRGPYTLKFTYPYATINGVPVKIPPETNLDIVEKKTTIAKVDITQGKVNVSYTDNPSLPSVTGQLRVETSPAAEVSISIHPGFVRTGDVNSEQINAGDYTLSFSYPYKINTVKLPPETNVAVRGGTTTFVKVDITTGTVTTSYENNSNIPSTNALLSVKISGDTEAAKKVSISIHPGFVRTWGVNWEAMAKGSYTLQTTYPYSKINGQQVKIPPELNFDILTHKTTSLKLDLTGTNSTSTTYTWY